MKGKISTENNGKYQNNMNKVKILFVCMGNICRSPTAHGVFEHLVKAENLDDKIEIDSAGTHAYHVGESPDRRASETALKYNVDLSYISARKVHENDFEYYDYILAMDWDNLDKLKSACPEEHQHKLSLFLDFAPQVSQKEVPDPYYGGIKGFENVFNLVNEASEGLLETIKRKGNPPIYKAIHKYRGLV